MTWRKSFCSSSLQTLFFGGREAMTGSASAVHRLALHRWCFRMQNRARLQETCTILVYSCVNFLGNRKSHCMRWSHTSSYTVLMMQWMEKFLTLLLKGVLLESLFSSCSWVCFKVAQASWSHQVQHQFVPLHNFALHLLAVCLLWILELVCSNAYTCGARNLLHQVLQRLWFSNGACFFFSTSVIKMLLECLAFIRYKIEILLTPSIKHTEFPWTERRWPTRLLALSRRHTQKSTCRQTLVVVW